LVAGRRRPSGSRGTTRACWCSDLWRSDLFESHQSLGYLERGEYAPSLHLALRIAAFFEVPVEVVFSTEPFPLLGSGRAG